jgi:hypothetical protein
MNLTHKPGPRHPLHSLLKLALVTAVLAGCGGGGGGGSSSTTSFAYGPITGFGSIVVNGVRFDDYSSSVSSEDDDNSESRSKSDLKLGMVVQVKAGSIQSDDSGRRGSASEIRYGSEIVGPVGPNPAADTFTLLGQVVKVSATTIYDNSSSSAPLRGFADIQTGDVLEVYGLLDAAGQTYSATRIERKNNALEYKVRGAISALDSSAAVKTFKIGSETIFFGTATKLPNTLANNQIVRVKLQTAKNATGAWVAIRVKDARPSMDDSSEAEVKGTVAGLSGASRTFTVSGIEVDATSAAIYPGNLANGALVEVEGALVGGKLIARKVELEDSNSTSSGAFEFHGRVAGLNAARTSFAVHGVTLTINDATSFIRGAARATLADGQCVEVRATSAMLATEVKLDNDCAP